jgi:hypothetical protein
MTHAVEKAHASLGASGADRWMNCTGSVRMTEGLPNVDTVYTKEGTAAHTLLEKCLQLNVEPVVFLDTELHGVAVTEDMCEAVQVAVDYVRGLAASKGAELTLEKRFSLATLNPPAPMFGTSDCQVYLPSERHLYVIDYKHGVGYAVDARGNPQLRYYGLGAILDGAWSPQQVEHVTLVIIQPRAVHPDGIIRSETITFEELYEWSGELMAKADETLHANAPLTTGPWCRFCRASAQCPARLTDAQALARIEFASDEIVPPAVESLTLPEMILVMEKAPVIEAWLKDIRTHIETTLIAGGVVPGYKLVAKRATRKWGNEQATVAFLEQTGFDADEYETRKLKSPAQVEKLIGKKNLPTDLVVKESSGYTVAPEYDKRPALLPGHDFAALPPASSDET